MSNRKVKRVVNAIAQADKSTSSSPTKSKKVKIILFLLVIIVIAVIIVAVCSKKPPVDGGLALTIHFIDVGQGDSIFIQFPDGQTMLIDGGDRSNAIATDLTDYLLDLYSTDTVNIDYCMLTHTDLDHCGSLDDVINHYKINVKCVYQPRVVSTYEYDMLQSGIDDDSLSYDNLPVIETNAYADFVEAVHNEMQADICQQVVYNFEGQIISGDGWSIHIYNPSEEIYADLATGSQLSYEKNNVSPIMVLSCNGKTILFTGDADEDAEQNFLSNICYQFSDNFVWNGDCDVLKVGHHGGEQSSTQAFLQVVKPNYSVICVGDNSYGHPNQQTLDRLDDYSRDNIFTTQEHGNIVLKVFDGDIIWAFESLTNVYIYPQYTQLAIMA